VAQARLLPPFDGNEFYLKKNQQHGG